MKTVWMQIDGMLAVHAVRAVYTAFAGVPGILRADVTLGAATVVHDGSVSRESIEEAVRLAGFAVRTWREERSLPTL